MSVLGVLTQAYWLSAFFLLGFFTGAAVYAYLDESNGARILSELEDEFQRQITL